MGQVAGTFCVQAATRATAEVKRGAVFAVLLLTGGLPELEPLLAAATCFPNSGPMRTQRTGLQKCRL